MCFTFFFDTQQRHLQKSEQHNDDATYRRRQDLVGATAQQERLTDLRIVEFHLESVVLTCNTRQIDNLDGTDCNLVVVLPLRPVPIS